MGLIARLLERERRSGVANPEAWLINAVGGNATAAGVRVTEETALQSVAVYACVRIIAEAVASLPLITYRRLEPRGKERATGHWLYPLLHDAPNPELTAPEFRELLTAHLQLWGNAYAEVIRDGGGRVLALWPLPPWRTAPERVGPRRAIVYRVQADGGGPDRVLTAGEVFHLRGLGTDGLRGLSVVGLAREAIGLSQATLEYGARFFGNGARPGGVLEHPGKLSDQAYARLRDSWEDRHRGAANAARIAVLEEGLKYQQVGLPPEDAQFLQTRNYQRNEIATLFRVPPHMVGDMERSTHSNIEQQSQEFVSYSLTPWLVRWESRIAKDLLPATDRGQLFAEHLLTALLRGDTLARYQAYAIGRQWGYLSANDVRELENMNPAAGGDAYLVPLNMVPADQVGLAGAGEANPGAPAVTAVDGGGTRARAERRAETRSLEARRRLGQSYRRVFADAARRVLRREEADVLREARRLLGQRDARDEFLAWLQRFYQDHRQFVAERMRAAFAGYCEAIAAEAAEEVSADPATSLDLTAFVDAFVAEFAAEHCDISLRHLTRAFLEGIDAGDPLTALTARFEDWQGTEDEPGRASDISRIAAVSAGAAAAATVWRRAGVRYLRWHSFGGSCPYCTGLSGRIVGMDQPFLSAGDGFQPDGARAPLNPRRAVKHPPAHGKCDCVIAPA